MKGHIKWIDYNLGVGYIRQEFTESNDILLKTEDIIGNDILHMGDKVEFDLKETNSGYISSNIRPR